MKFFRKKPIFLGTTLSLFAVFGYYGLSFVQNGTYNSDDFVKVNATIAAVAKNQNGNTVKKAVELPSAVHIKTPEPLKAIYITSCVAASAPWRNGLIKMIETTELNSVVVDVKDYSGTISFAPETPILKENSGNGCRAGDMGKFLSDLHNKGIYAIGRITVFQDPYYTSAHPELSVKKLSDGTVWKDYKGLSFVDVGSRPFWDYIVALAKESHSIGFDEINFDYIRFPSDGDMKDVDYGSLGGKTKAETLREFFAHLYNELKPTGMVISVDLFGMTTTNQDDLNIGQVLENTFPYFDYVSPMVYPSHYPPNFNGWANPNKYVYEVVKYSMDKAVLRAESATSPILLPGETRIGTTTPPIYTKPVYDRRKLRPWLQDFDYGGNYGVAEVRAQIQATYDSGLTSWMLWDPANRYTKEALNPKD